MKLLLPRVLVLATALVAFNSLLAAPAKGPAPASISHGATVRLEEHAVPGKTTIFDFYSEFCPPCVAIAPALERLHASRPDIAVVKVDVNRPDVRGIDWKSPVVAQFGLNSIPHFKIYSPEGKLIAEGDAAKKMVRDWLK